MEVCLYLGVRNTFMVPVGINVNHRQYNKSFKTLRQVGWDCFEATESPEKLDELIGDAAEFPNIGCVVFDDFCRIDTDNVMKYKKIPIYTFKALQYKVHNNGVRRLNSWMVLYTYEFGLNTEDDTSFQPFVDMFDGIIMWTWEEKDVPLIPEKFEIFRKMTQNNRRMFGCYLYNFGENKKATGDAVKWQLDWYREKFSQARPRVLCSTPIQWPTLTTRPMMWPVAGWRSTVTRKCRIFHFKSKDTYMDNHHASHTVDKGAVKKVQTA